MDLGFPWDGLGHPKERGLGMRRIPRRKGIQGCDASPEEKGSRDATHPQKKRFSFSPLVNLLRIVRMFIVDGGKLLGTDTQGHNGKDG